MPMRRARGKSIVYSPASASSEALWLELEGAELWFPKTKYRNLVANHKSDIGRCHSLLFTKNKS